MTRKRSRYVIGIDLGTTNSAVAYIDTRVHPTGGGSAIQTFDIPQLIAEGQVSNREGLPSFLYLSTGHDLPAGSFDLPWVKDSDFYLPCQADVFDKNRTVIGEMKKEISVEHLTRKGVI